MACLDIYVLLSGKSNNNLVVLHTHSYLYRYLCNPHSYRRMSLRVRPINIDHSDTPCPLPSLSHGLTSCYRNILFTNAGFV